MTFGRRLVGPGLLVALTYGCDDGGLRGPPQWSQQPPPPPKAAPAGDGPGHYYAVTRLHLGDATRDGVLSTEAWQDFGFDIDHRLTTRWFDGHCTPHGGSPSRFEVFGDGPHGIDNAFAKSIVPILRSLFFYWPDEGDEPASLGDLATASIESGDTTLILWLSDLGNAPDYDPVDAYAFAAREGDTAGFRAAPEALGVTDGTDVAASLRSANTHFHESYVRDHTWASGLSETAPLGLDLVLNGVPIRLRIHKSVVTMRLSGDRSSATTGTIAGILETEDLVQQLRDYLGTVDTSFCDGAAVESILNQLRSYSDIPLDGTHYPSLMCDGISIGIGFEAAEIAPIAAIAEPLVLPDPCAQL